MPHIAILGGSLSGIYAALKLAEGGYQVSIIEAAPVLGGLMNSYSYEFPDNGPLKFDVGTHYLLFTGDEEIDSDIRSVMKHDDWQWFEESLLEGHYYGGRLDCSTGCLDLTNHEKHREFLADLILAPGEGDGQQTLAECWRSDFGDQLLNDILEQICNKFMGKHPDEVAKEAYGIFAPYRLKLVPGEKAAMLKGSVFLDRRLSFAHRSHGTSIIQKAYPRHGKGIGAWVMAFEKKLVDVGVKIFSGVKISDPKWDGKRVTALNLSTSKDATKIEFDTLASSLAPAIVARALGIKIPQKPVAFRNLILNHYLFDTPYRNDELHWVTNYDPGMKSFRTTLYENITKDDSGHYRMTIETISEGTGDEDIAKDVLEEARVMKLIAENVEPIFQTSEVRARAFPVLLPGWQENLRVQTVSLLDQVDDLRILGNSSSTVFGQINNLKATSDEMRQLMS